MSDVSDPAQTRPVDERSYDTEELPPLPVRDRTILASSWHQAPAGLLTLGDDIGSPRVAYKRRIGPWLLWRAGPPSKADARYMALHADDLSRTFVFTLQPDGSGSGVGPSGETHARFRTWKEDLRDHPDLT